MHEICHRCGGELSATDGGSPFCPHCGAPQLLLSDYTQPLSTGDVDPNADPGTSTRTLPPPRPNQIDWRMAIVSAAIVSGIASLLGILAARLPTISPLTTVWVVSASLTTLALYQRRRPLATMNAGVGAKIGVLVGVLLVFSLGTTLAAGMTIARFALHSLSGFDSDTALAMKAQLAQLSATRPIPADTLALINSMQFRTTMMLSGFGLMLAGVLLISVFGGAVGGLLRTRRLKS